ncbi:MAG: helix-turn-helix transcriptional regulator [Tabrizicola sp.]|nr:helix-turn-helix transcriptional regulator [Tabrizicola sp.]
MIHRSGCPINLTIEVLGDRWSVIVLRDMMFGNRRTYGELLNLSLERIASNILAARMQHLLAEGLVTSAVDPSHKQRKIYSLTENAIQLVPAIVHLGAWGLQHTPSSPVLSIRARLLADGGPKLWEAFMSELRYLHLGTAQPQVSVLAELETAYRAASEAAISSA